MLIQNLHTHTIRCGHARGTEREYIEAAIDAGIQELGFSDHSPILFPNKDYYSTMRMYPDELQGYCDTLLALKEEYREDITLHIGLELEFYPDLFEGVLSWLSSFPIEYLLLGQHYLGNEIGCPYTGRPTSDPTILRAYVRQACAGMQTGVFTYLAHPDLIYFTGDVGLYRQEMAKICQTAEALSIPLEFNINGTADRRNYPNPVFWELASRYSIQAIIGSDAHFPEMLEQPEAEYKCRSIAERYGIRILDSIPLRNPF